MISGCLSWERWLSRVLFFVMRTLLQWRLNHCSHNSCKNHNLLFFYCSHTLLFPDSDPTHCPMPLSVISVNLLETDEISLFLQCHRKFSDSYSHAFEPWQGSQGPQSSEGSQRFNGTEFIISHSVCCHTDQWHLDTKIKGKNKKTCQVLMHCPLIKKRIV